MSGYDGHKWQCIPKDLEKMRVISDKLCIENGLSVIENRGTFNMQYGEYMAKNSWKRQLATDISESLKYSSSFDQFVTNLSEKDLKIKVHPPNYAGYTFVFTVPEGYCGLGKEMQRSSNKLMGYGDFSEENIINILDFNGANETSGSWPEEIASELLNMFDLDVDNVVISDSHNSIDWKAYSWPEIQEIIGRLKAHQKNVSLSRSIQEEQSKSKQNREMLLSCSSQWLDWFIQWRTGKYKEEREEEEVYEVEYEEDYEGDDEWDR